MMRHQSFLSMVPVFLLCVPMAASAQTPCDDDADCAVDETCVRVPCAAVPCEEGGACPEPVCEPEGYCVGKSAPLADECAADADCPDGFTCETALMPCADVACPPCECACPDGEEPCDCACEPCTEPEPCEPITYRYCMYAPKACAQDADCGEGFACEVQEACTVSGCDCSAGCACPECVPGEECPPCDCEQDPVPCECPENPEPVCEVLGQYCVPAEIACEADGDCPADFACVNWDAPVCACAACACDPEAPDCECEPCTCPEPEETDGTCMPRSWADAGIPAGAEPQPGEAAAEYARDTTADGNGDEDGAGTDKGAGLAAGAGSTGCVAGASRATVLLPFLLAFVAFGALRRRTVRR
jgi:hypothetical protein